MTYSAICPRCGLRYGAAVRDGWIDVERCGRCLEENPKFLMSGQVITSATTTHYKNRRVRRIPLHLRKSR